MTDLLLLDRLTYNQKVLNTSRSALIAYWPLSESSGATINDASGAGRNGTATGFNWGQVGIGDGKPAPSLDGTTSYGNVLGASLTAAFNNQEGTAALWAKVSGAGVWTDATQRYLLRLLADGNNQVILTKSSTNNLFDFRYTAGSVIKSAAFASGAPAGWVHVAITWSKSADQVKMWLGGAQQGATLTGLGVWAGALTLATIGAGNTTPANVWSGFLAHVAIWTTPLAAAQISNLARVN